MRLKTLFSAYAVFSAVSGAAMLMVPSTVMRFYRVPELDFVATSLARDVGTLMLGLAVMCWIARGEGPSRSRDGLTLGLGVVNGLWAVLTVVAGVRLGGWFVWAEIPFFAALAVLFVTAGLRGRSGAGAA